MSDFLAALCDRVLIFDGAFGTWVQEQDLGPDDFGGPELEGCNEHVVLTRPDLIAEMHREFFDVGVDAVETATFGSFPVVLSEYGIPEKTYELNEAAARIAKEVASGFATLDRPRYQASVTRSHRVRRAARRLRDADRRSARGGRRRPPHRDCVRPTPGKGRRRRSPAGDGEGGPRSAAD